MAMSKMAKTHLVLAIVYLIIALLTLSIPIVSIIFFILFGVSIYHVSKNDPSEGF